MTRRARATGAAWEDAAARFLQAEGLRIVARHYHCRLGEIDLIAADGDTIVFVEVRFRACDEFGGAAASVTRNKQLRIMRAARHFIMCNPQFAERPMRIDVIAVQGGSGRLRWISDAFAAD